MATWLGPSIPKTLPGNGYVLHNGKITLLLVPGSDITPPTSINDQGVIVGGYLLTCERKPSLYVEKRGVQQFDPPGSYGFVTRTRSAIQVWWWEAYEAVDGTHGFAFENGTYTKIDVPGFFRIHSSWL